MTMNAAKPRYLELEGALKDVKSYFVYAGVFSAAVNVLMLVPVIYMLQVYDRVMSSGSLSTLGMLTLLMVALLCALGGFEWVRSMILISASNRIELVSGIECNCPAHPAAMQASGWKLGVCALCRAGS